MKKLLILFAMLFLLPASAMAEEKAVPVQFEKYGGGQFIYCNNREFTGEIDLSTTENPKPIYMMNNDDLKSDNYAVFFCFYNWTYYDLEPDIEFKSDNDAEITINSIGYYIPEGYDYWDCIGAWSDLLGVNIRTMNGLSSYVPYKGNDLLPVTLKLSEAGEWISKYIYNYDVVPPHVTFNMLVNFTINSGEVDVNFAALKNYGKTGDRSHHSPNAGRGEYVNDTAIKGIETETLPIVQAQMDIDINDETEGVIPVKVYNQYYNDGNVFPYWMTNINPSRDGYIFSKFSSAGSDMLEFTYEDDSKLRYYGKNVPESERDNVWRFDIYHQNTTEYKEGMPWSRDDHIPNKFTSKTLDINNLPNLEYEFNIGNFGVCNRYKFNLTNSGTKERYFEYLIEGSISSNIVIVRDEDGNILNPYTLEEDEPFALCKGTHPEKVKDCMFSVNLKPGEEKTYLVDVILPTNCYGGIVNEIRVSDEKRKYPKITEFAEYTNFDEHKDAFFNGETYMDWDGSELYEYKNGWKKVEIPQNSIFDSLGSEFRMVKLDNGYAARFSGWDGYGLNVIHQEVKNKLYLLDDKFNLIEEKEFNDYISDFVYDDGKLFIASDKNYVMENGNIKETKEIFPEAGGKHSIYKNTDGYYLDGKSKILYEEYVPNNILSGGDLFYDVSSLKNYDTDLTTGNVINVSKDGVYWKSIYMPNHPLRFEKVDYIGDKIYVHSRYDLKEVSDDIFDENVIVKLNNEVLGFAQPAKIVNERTMVPLRYFFEKLGAKVEWLDDTREVEVSKNGKTVKVKIDSADAYVDGKLTVTDSAPYIENDKTMMPLRFLSENLGYNVSWNQDGYVVDINAEW